MAALMIVSFVVFVFCRTVATSIIGGTISEEVILTMENSPYRVDKDIIIEKEGNLTIDAGVKLLFSPGTGVTVRGTLIAKGGVEQENRILFTRRVVSIIDEYPTDLPRWLQIRLVDGNSILEGRLQIFYKDKWRSVCTNSKNWTEVDLQVICQQLGFSGGSIYHWFQRNKADSQLMYQNPNCSGRELSISECPNWNKRKLGNGICDFHFDIGIQCQPLLQSEVQSYWRGISFENALNERKIQNDKIVYRKESSSILQNVDIMYAGRDADNKAVSALQIRGVPPEMKGLNIRWSAYNGINITQPQEALNIENSTIANNRGFGIYINTSNGMVNLRQVEVKDNGGDGIRYVFHDPYIVVKETFCQTVNLGTKQKYPFVLSQYQERYRTNYQPCKKLFQVNGNMGHTLTIHFPVIISDEADEQYAGKIEVFDGYTDSSQLLAIFKIINGTRPQSVTSTRNSVYMHYHPPLNSMVLFTIEVEANIGKAYDLNLTDCIIANNNGRGLTVENQRSGTFINWTRITGNNHVGGVNILDGCGDIVVNNSVINGNIGDGINISYAGGFRHFDRSHFSNNTGNGISLWFNETSHNRVFNFTSHLSYSTFSNNEIGVFIGNICLENSLWNISMNTFSFQRNHSIHFLSCLMENTSKKSSLQIFNNKFEYNQRLSIHIVPAVNIHAVIQHNRFTNHERGVLLISNQGLYQLSSISSIVEIAFNEFTENKGTFVCSVGLSENSLEQQLNFTKNRLFDNIIKEPFASLNPRSRAAAVIAVSSTNALIYRNYLKNPSSSYELSSHLDVPSAIINATYNFWGEEKDSRVVYEKIFDTKDRYNLAQVEFLPFITLGTDLDTTYTSKEDERHLIMPFRQDDTVGGIVMGEVTIEKRTVTVTRDIYVTPGSKLHIHPEAKLLFKPFIGMMVQGELHSEGRKGREIVYSIAPSAYSGIVSTNVYLSNQTEGKLEVQIDGITGSVCSYGWDIQDAAVVCHQLGLVLNPHDWLLERSQFHSGNKPIVLSNVQCTELDTDLTNCKAERMQDFENSCMEEVGIRCYPQSWAGLRLGMIAKESFLKHIIIENAGIFDYTTHNFKPALQVDFNHHKLENMIIRRNSDSGLGIMWNDIFYNSDRRKVTDSEMLHNVRHGIVTHSQGLHITRCNLLKNSESGVHYDPMFTRDDQRDLISWINKDDQNLFITIPEDIGNGKISIQRERTYLVFKPIKEMKPEYKFQISANVGQKLGIMVISPFSSHSTEEMIILGPDVYNFYNSERFIWDLRKNLTSFPLRNPSYSVDVEYRPGDRPDYSAILHITRLEGEHHDDDNIYLKVTSSEISECGKGISSNHYNSDFSDNGDHYHRYSNETIIVEDVQIKQSKDKALFVWTPFWDPSLSNLAEINYTLLRNTFENNADGIVQYNRNIRNSKNLFHWTINDTHMVNNLGGGIDVRLPFVWQYSENYTHSFVMHNTSFSNNEFFSFSLSGHFSRVNMTNNTFFRNICKKGLMSLSGMEKETLMEHNLFESNSCKYIVDFNMESHADKFGTVNANFQRNILRKNNANNSPSVRNYEPYSYSVAIRGVQQINMTRNILDNPYLEYEFIAGIHTGSIENTINVAENWWGTVNHTFIKNRIFDFDDWNNFAIADYFPFLSSDSVDAFTYSSAAYTEFPNLDLPLGGRIYKSLTLTKRNTPYIVKSDLTVLPNVTLTIEAGVTMEFYPSIGILVLGNLRASGKVNDHVVLKPIKIESLPRFRRAIPRLSSDVRLCIDEECKERRKDGFLEIFNKTTLQWIPVCDRRFTERNSEVVCRQLGYSTFNVHLRRGHRFDVDLTSLSRFKYWPHPLECSGDEPKLTECEFRLNGYSDHSYDCSDLESFVYIYCGEDSLSERYTRWGGLRFSLPNFERSNPKFQSKSKQSSTAILNHVEIQGAGILHGENNAALQAVLREIEMDDVRITESASHGVEIIGSSGSIFFNNMIIEHNLGMGINFLTLIGETSQKSDLKYKPLKAISFPYNVFGMVSVCDTNKEMVVHERILLYYKYDNKPVDCVKIFSSAHYIKTLGFRLLQFNLFNATDYAASPDMIKIIDGDIFNESMPVIAQLGVWNKSIDMSSETKFYKSSEGTLSVHLHASGASGIHGFIAEIVALPPFYTGMDRGVMHNVSNSKISRNVLNAISYRSAGEIAPIITFKYNRIENNGKEFFGNFTSTNSSVLLDVRNADEFVAHNNLFLSNQGGLHIYADSEGNVPSLDGIVTNNLFIRNKNREVLLIKGGNTYQEVKIFRNYFTRNFSPYSSNIELTRIRSEFLSNVLYNNTGIHQLSVFDFEGTSSNQRCIKNYFFDNKAVQPDERSTIVAANPYQIFHNNYLVNPDNDYELTTVNQSRYVNSLKNKNEFYHAYVDASYNWWGFESLTAVQGRIKDHDDFEDFLKVKFHPYYKDNSSVLSGKCAGGWHQVGSTCFMYVGGIMTYNEAKKLCESDNGSIPYVKSNHEELSNFVKTQQIYYKRSINRLWVQSIDIPLRRCAILQDETVREHNCDDYLPFLCERDPQIIITAQQWYQEPLAIAALTVAAVAAIFTIVCVSFWLCKSRQRYREKLSRRNSIRASMRSNRSLTSAGYGNICYNRRLEQPAKLDITSEKKINGSIDSIEKSPSRFSCSLDDTHSYDTSETQNQPVFDTRFNDIQLENETANTLVRPTFDLTYKNNGFVERSEESRDWSTGSDSTLNMKRTLEQDNRESKDEVYQSTPSMYNTTSSSSNYDSKRPLETAM
ncbi:protein bark beetle [Centruroides vittatus]|uniref:protein bark beetle n=1 Tax=Centruroides vittatus TaxID=120091 RepID=UPI00350EBADB